MSIKAISEVTLQNVFHQLRKDSNASDFTFILTIVKMMVIVPAITKVTCIFHHADDIRIVLLLLIQ